MFKEIMGVNARDIDQWADQKAESGLLKLVGRGAMVASVPMALAAMTWLGTTLWQINATLASQGGKIDALTERITSAAEGRYRSSDAEKDFKIRDQFIVFLRESVERLERRVERIEQRASQP